MRLILHVGTEKTGSTSVQRFLGRNRPALLTRGALYSEAAGADNHTKLVAYSLNDEKIDTIRMMYNLHCVEDIERFRQKFAQDIRAEVGALPIRTLLFSNEHCSTRLLKVEDVERLHDLMAGLATDVRVLVYLRRQDEYLVSLYSTAVKSGAIGKLILPGPDLVKERYDYDILLNRWASVFGQSNLEVRIYSRNALVNGDSIDDFLSVAGLETGEDFVRPPRHLSNSLDVVSLEYLRKLNRHIPLFEGQGLTTHRGNIDAVMEHIADSGPQLTLPDDVMDQFMAQFAESNARVADAYFGGREAEGDPLFGVRREQHDKKVEAEIDMDDVFRITAGIWKTKQTECANLRQHIRELRQALAAEKDERVLLEAVQSA